MPRHSQGAEDARTCASPRTTTFTPWTHPAIVPACAGMRNGAQTRQRVAPLPSSDPPGRGAAQWHSQTRGRIGTSPSEKSVDGVRRLTALPIAPVSTRTRDRRGLPSGVAGAVRGHGRHLHAAACGVAGRALHEPPAFRPTWPGTCRKACRRRPTNSSTYRVGRGAYFGPLDALPVPAASERVDRSICRSARRTTPTTIAASTH